MKLTPSKSMINKNLSVPSDISESSQSLSIPNHLRKITKDETKLDQNEQNSIDSYCKHSFKYSLNLSKRNVYFVKI